MEKIISLNNPKVKLWSKLKEKKERDKENLFLVENEHLVNEAKKANCLLETISLEENIEADYYVTKEIMQKISNQKSLPKIVGVCQKIKPREIKDKIIILDNLQDPGNLGTIIRSAVAFNIDTIILSDDSVDLYNEKVLRATEGMIFNINIIRVNLEEFLKNIKKDIPVLITDVKNGKNIKKILPLQKFALIIGSEGQGVKESLKKYATEFIKINMNNTCESLNAGVAGSILMYEINEANYE